MSNARAAEHDVDRLFIDRQSPRSFTGEEIPDAALFSMFEAARWSPSSSNIQPWRFIYAKKHTPAWAGLFDALMPGNQRWASSAAALVAFVSRIHTTRGDEQIVSPWHGFDTGAAWMSFALQAHMLGWATHAMAGFYADLARQNLAVPDGYDILAIVAVGRRGAIEALPEDLREREPPTTRRSLIESVFEGKFTQR